MKRRILILGGTTESRLLAQKLADRGDLEVTLSLAGRTASPLAQPVPIRSGGFGGEEGLAAYLQANHIDALIDATHPFASAISANARHASAKVGTPILAVQRAPWLRQAGDRWTEIDAVADAPPLLGDQSKRVFLALGRQELAPFVGAPHHHYLIRSVDPVDPPLDVPHVRYILARGPFTEADDRDLLASHAIDVIVSKNSGGTSTYGKIAAARALGITVLLVRRPEPASDLCTVDEAMSRLDHMLALLAARGV